MAAQQLLDDRISPFGIQETGDNHRAVFGNEVTVDLPNGHRRWTETTQPQLIPRRIVSVGLFLAAAVVSLLVFGSVYLFHIRPSNDQGDEVLVTARTPLTTLMTTVGSLSNSGTKNASKTVLDSHTPEPTGVRPFTCLCVRDEETHWSNAFINLCGRIEYLRDGDCWNMFSCRIHISDGSHRCYCDAALQEISGNKLQMNEIASQYSAYFVSACRLKAYPIT